MIISKTPFRISLFGGGTDYPAWWHQHGGVVIGTTINKYCYLTVNRLRPFFEFQYRIIWSKIEDVIKIEDIEHSAVRAVLKGLAFENEGLEISYRADLPARSGLGTSSSFTVGLLNALVALRGARTSKKRLADEAIYYEQTVMRESVGCQDQIWAAYGGFNLIEFFPGPDAHYRVIPLKFRGMSSLCSSFMLFFTGFTRTASVLAERQIRNMDQNTSILNEIMDLCRVAYLELEHNDDPSFKIGKLLDESWKLKRKLAEGMTTERLDQIYATALAAGAIGGKLLGAGGGGFFLFVVPPDAQERVKERLGNLVHVPFEFDLDGSKIVVDDEGTDVTKGE